MSLVINHNMMAANTARTLNTHYANLSRSTQRLSSGLRINSAADDAAGLAIRELQRADIAALNQGVRNANDAISLIQTADGALQVIDEKLIRMKELAEQSATGTYDSTQRMLIDSEYQAMAAEITRIAKATDFNGIQLLNGNLASALHDGSGTTASGKLKVHFGTGNDCAEDFYYIQIKETTAGAFSLGSESTWDDAVGRFSNELKDNLKVSLQDKIGDGTGGTITRAVYNKILASVDDLAAQLAGSGNVKDQATLDDRVSNTELDTTYTLPNDFDTLSDDDMQKLAYAFGRDVVNKLASGEVDVKNWKVFGSDTDVKADTENSLAKMLGSTGTVEEADAALAYMAASDAYVAGLKIGPLADDTLRTAFANAAVAYKDAGGTLDPDVDKAVTGFLGGITPATQGSLDAQAVPISKQAETIKKEYAGYIEAKSAATNAQDAFNAAKAAKDGADAAALANDRLWETAVTNFEQGVARLDAAKNYQKAAAEYQTKITAGTVLAPSDHEAFAAAVRAYSAAGGAADIDTNVLDAANDYWVDKEDPAMATALQAVIGDAITDAAAMVAADTGTLGAPAAPGTAATGLYLARDNAATAKATTDAAKATADKTFAEASAALDVANTKKLGSIPGGANAVGDIINAAAQQAAQSFVKTYDYDGMNIASQENAQIALDAINNAIVEKDKIRANLGALQNRLENTISNLNIQAENLQAAESRISDVDVSTEMTEFVRNQILAQSATAMLSQANSLPRMATQIIGG